MFCPYCGRQLADDAAFCSGCGTFVAEKTPQQQPYVPAPQQPAPSAVQQTYIPQQPYSAPAPAAKPKRGRKHGLVIGITAAVLLFAAAAVGAIVTVLNNRTVWMLTESLYDDGWTAQTQRYEYTDDGRMAGYYLSSETEYGEYSYSYEYKYDDGALKSVVCKVNGKRTEYDYVYDDDGNIEGLESRDEEYEVECDKDGRIVSVEHEDDPEVYAEYSYYKNGMLKEAEISTGYATYLNNYDEQGNVVSMEILYYDEVVQTSESEYDGDGRRIHQCITVFDDGRESYVTEYDFSYDGDVMVSYEMTMSNKTGSVTVLLEGEDGRLELEEVKTEGKGFNSSMEELADLEERDVDVEYVYDEDGNILEIHFGLGDHSNYERINEYTKVVLPWGKRIPNINEPMYFYYFIQ